MRYFTAPLTSIARWLAIGLAALALQAVPSFSDSAEAQTRSLQEGPVVRRQLLYRSARFEIAPALGASIGPVYQRDLLLSVTARYHINNSLAVGLNAAGGLLTLNTSIANNYEEADPVGSRDLYYSRQLALVDLHLAYSLFTGKMSLMSRSLSYLDLYIAAGGGGAFVGADSAAEDLGGFRFGPAFTVGLRVFITDQIAMNLRFTDYLYSGADAQRVVRGSNGLAVAQPIDERFRSHFMGALGVSIFFPGEVRVSR